MRRPRSPSHFVNNVLAAAASYIEDDPDTARDVLAELGRVPVPPPAPGPLPSRSAQELDHVGVYLRLQQARFPDRIEAELPATATSRASASRPGDGAGPLGDALGARLGERAGPRVARARRARTATTSRLSSTAPDDPEPAERVASPWQPRRCGCSDERPAWPSSRSTTSRGRSPTSSACSRPRPSVDRVATATSAKEALVYLCGGRYDALLPRRRACPRSRAWRSRACCAASPTRPAVVFLTGHPDAAVEAFEVQALDFLVKPVTRERLDAALRPRRAHAAQARRGAHGGGPPTHRRRRGAPDVVAVDNPEGGGKRLVRARDDPVAQANGDYARIHCDRRRFLLRTPLSQLEKDWARRASRACTAPTS